MGTAWCCTVLCSGIQESGFDLPRKVLYHHHPDNLASTVLPVETCAKPLRLGLYTSQQPRVQPAGEEMTQVTSFLCIFISITVTALGIQFLYSRD